jgi:hypothetical protein
MVSPKKAFVMQKFKQRPPKFNFFNYTLNKLSQKADHKNFIRYADTYKILGQTFCFAKQTSKEVLDDLEVMGLLEKKKRGIELCQMNTPTA